MSQTTESLIYLGGNSEYQRKTLPLRSDVLCAPVFAAFTKMVIKIIVLLSLLFGIPSVVVAKTCNVEGLIDIFHELDHCCPINFKNKA